jgi:hypothetical protein
MPPEPSPLELSLRTRALWRELTDVYDAIEGRLTAAAWDGGAALAGRLGELETSLRPLMTALAALRSRPASDPGLVRLWSEIDAAAARLAARLPRLTRTATAARDAAAARLVRLHAGRAGAGTYRGAAVAPRFASQRV